MTTTENSLALYLVNESFGEIARTVASLLIKKHKYPFILISDELKIGKKKVFCLIVKKLSLIFKFISLKTVITNFVNSNYAQFSGISAQL